MRHGSYAGAQVHYRAGEKPCDLCRGAHNEYQRLWRKYGPLDNAVYTPARVVRFLELCGPQLMRHIQMNVEGKDETVRRSTYRLIDRGEIMLDPYTKLYSVGGG